MAFSFYLFAWTLLISHGSSLVATRGWTSLPVKVPENLTEFGDYLHNRVQVAFGTPSQAIDLTIDFREDLLSVWSSDCIFCPSYAPFYSSRSSTLESEGRPWDNDNGDAHGMWHNDIFGFGGLRAEDVPFVLTQEMRITPGAAFNGILGLWTNPTDTNSRKNLLRHLWDQDLLLNPVIGLRLDPMSPRMTIGALDPGDYEGAINWVEVGGSGRGDVQHGFNIDGVKGYNGSIIPFSGEREMTAAIDSFLNRVFVPPNVYTQYFENPDYHGFTIAPYPMLRDAFSYECPRADEGAFPPASFTVTINGIDYPLEEPNNMIRPLGTVNDESRNCTVAIGETATPDPEDVILGLPFLRSVYITYRFPAPNSPECPAYIGFAFPKGMTRSTEQLSQAPRSPPPRANQCLVLTPPTGEPATVPESQFQRSAGEYSVYGEKSGRQVPLVGANELRQRA